MTFSNFRLLHSPSFIYIYIYIYIYILTSILLIKKLLFLNGKCTFPQKNKGKEILLAHSKNYLDTGLYKGRGDTWTFTGREKLKAFRLILFPRKTFSLENIFSEINF
jgi:hypothetical protein